MGNAELGNQGIRRVSVLLVVLLLLVGCRRDCDDVQGQLKAITECKDFAITDCGVCGECVQELINGRMMELGCKQFQTAPPGAGSCTWDVTQGGGAYPPPEEPQ